MFEAISALAGLVLTVIALVMVAVGFIPFFYLGFKQLFGDENEK